MFTAFATVTFVARDRADDRARVSDRREREERDER